MFVPRGGLSGRKRPTRYSDSPSDDTKKRKTEQISTPARRTTNEDLRQTSTTPHSSQQLISNIVSPTTPNRSSMMSSSAVSDMVKVTRTIGSSSFQSSVESVDYSCDPFPNDFKYTPPAHLIDMMLGATSVLDWKGRVVRFWAEFGCKYRYLQKGDLNTLRRHLLPKHIKNGITPSARIELEKHFGIVQTAFRKCYAKQLHAICFVYLNKTPAGINLSKQLMNAEESRPAEGKYSIAMPQKARDLLSFNGNLGLEYVDYHHVLLSGARYSILAEETFDDGGIWIPKFKSEEARQKFTQASMIAELKDILWYIQNYGFNPKGISSRALQFHFLRNPVNFPDDFEWPQTTTYKDYTSLANYDLETMPCFPTKLMPSTGNGLHVYTAEALKSPPVFKFVISQDCTGIDSASAENYIRWGTGTKDDPFTRVGDMDGDSNEFVSDDASPSGNEEEEHEEEECDFDNHDNPHYTSQSAQLDEDGYEVHGDGPEDLAFRTGGNLSLTNSALEACVETAKAKHNATYEKYSRILQERGNAFGLLTDAKPPGLDVTRASSFVNMFWNGHPLCFGEASLELMRHYISAADITAMKFEADIIEMRDTCQKLIELKETLQSYLTTLDIRRKEAANMVESKEVLRREAEELTARANDAGYPSWLKTLKHKGTQIIEQNKKPDIARHWMDRNRSRVLESYPGEQPYKARLENEYGTAKARNQSIIQNKPLANTVQGSSKAPMTMPSTAPTPANEHLEPHIHNKDSNLPISESISAGSVQSSPFLISDITSKAFDKLSKKDEASSNTNAFGGPASDDIE